MRNQAISDAWRWPIAIVLAYAIVSGYWYACTAGLYRDSKPAGLFLSFAVLAVAIALALLAARGAGQIVNRRDPLGRPSDNGIAHYSLGGSFIQDAGLLSGLVAAVVWLGTAMYVHIPPTVAERSFVFAGVLVAFMFFFAPVMTWSLRNSVIHAGRFADWTGRAQPTPRARGLLPCGMDEATRTYVRVVRHKTPQDTGQAFSEMLDAHIAYQNLLAILLLVATVIGVFALLSEYQGKFD